MNRTRQLKLLDEEIRRLFSEEVNEIDAYDQLRSDPRFDSVKRSTVQSLYTKLQKDTDKKARIKELNNQKRYHQKANDLLLYEGHPIKNEDTMFDGTWEDRYFVVSNLTDDDYVNGFKVIDLYHGISKESVLLPEYQFDCIRALDGQFVLMTQHIDELVHVYLAHVDLVEGTVTLVQEAEKSGLRDVSTILFDMMDRSKFAIEIVSDQGNYSIIEYNLAGGKLNAGEKIVLENFDITLDIGSYTNNQLAALKFEDEHFHHINNASVFVQDLHGEKKSKLVKLKPLPKSVVPQRLGCYRWYSNRMLLTVQFCLTKRYGIAFTDPQTQNWSILEFAVDSPMVDLSFVDNYSLLISVGRRGQQYNHDEVTKVYKLPIKKPESLSREAWFKVVAFFKKQGVANPYKHALQFLPFNSNIQSLLNAEDRDNEEQ